MKKYSTQKALIASVLTLALCFTSLIGTTFAWFTDSVSNTGNVIQTGTLDVEFWMYNATADKYEDISNETDPIFGADGLIDQWETVDTVWEPGKTQIVYLAVKNAGSLALKYNIIVDVVDLGLVGALEYAIVDGATKTDADALNLAKWADITAISGVQSGLVAAGRTVAAESGAIVNKDDYNYFALAIHMDEDASNDYQDKSVVIDINILATQLSSEEDSFGSDYDKDATFSFYTASTPVTAGDNAVTVEIRDDDGYKVASVTAPKAALAEGLEEFQVNVKEDAPYANVTVAAGQESQGFDVSVLGLKENNTTPVTVELRIPAGLDPDTVKLYHYDHEISCYYNPSTGYVTFTSATFSPFTVVYDAESEYVAPEVPKDETGKIIYPTADVTYESQYVNVDLPWGSYGQWSPTAGLDSQLEAAFTFACPEELDTEFENWYCDFFVSLNTDLGENEIFLGGNYGTIGWVGFHNGTLTLPANTEIPLLSSVTTNPWTYAMVYNSVREFICGVGDVGDALNGATFTVKLRLINPEMVDTNQAEWWIGMSEDAYVDVNVVTYTFGGSYNVDGETHVSTGDQLQDAVNNGDGNIVLDGDIDLSQGIVIP